MAMEKESLNPQYEWKSANKNQKENRRIKEEGARRSECCG